MYGVIGKNDLRRKKKLNFKKLLTDLVSDMSEVSLSLNTTHGRIANASKELRNEAVLPTSSVYY